MFKHHSNDSLPGSLKKRAGQNRLSRYAHNTLPIRKHIPKNSPFSSRNQSYNSTSLIPHSQTLLEIPDISLLSPNELPSIEENSRLILSPSRKTVMEWSLLLTSQGISSTILYPYRRRWFLKVADKDHQSAQQLIRIYTHENRHFQGYRKLHAEKVLFNWGTLYWALPTGLSYWLNFVSHERLSSAGALSSMRFLEDGEWYRLITATFLHADIGHLASNLSIGFPLMGLAMGQYGIGWTLLGTLAAGIIGNLMSLGLHKNEFIGLGASGVIMGSLGLLAVHLFPLMGNNNLGTRLAINSLSAAGFIFILTGLSPDPQVDIPAHFGGFIGGILAGIILNRLPSSYLHHTLTNVILTIFWFTLCSFCWWIAIEK